MSKKKKHKRKEPSWQSRDGTVHPVREMTDPHLLGAILYLERRRGLFLEHMIVEMLGYAKDAPEGAWDAIQHELTELEETTPEQFLTGYAPYRLLYREALRRNLRVVPVTSWYVLRRYLIPLPNQIFTAKKKEWRVVNRALQRILQIPIVENECSLSYTLGHLSGCAGCAGYPPV